MSNIFIKIFAISCLVASCIAVNFSYTRDGIRVCSYTRMEPSRLLLTSTFARKYFDRSRCINISNANLKKTFPGRFMTVAQYQRNYNLPYFVQNNYKLSYFNGANHNPITSDGDSCCESWRYFTNAPYIVTVNNRPCYVIASISNGAEHQLVPNAYCRSNDCDGQCLPETTFHQVVCLQYNNIRPYWHFKLGYVETPLYCSCKNIHTEVESVETNRNDADSGKFST